MKIKIRTNFEAAETIIQEGDTLAVSNRGENMPVLVFNLVKKDELQIEVNPFKYISPMQLTKKSLVVKGGDK